MSASFASASAILRRSPRPLPSTPNDRASGGSMATQRGIFKGLNKNDAAVVHVLGPEHVAVQYIDSKAGIASPCERRRIARHELRRGRSPSTSRETADEARD